jgi:L,D-peptidoglycan transpeptidase YkuD (ErfK/YbiS/YcfS/YnhG family)
MSICYWRPLTILAFLGACGVLKSEPVVHDDPLSSSHQLVVVTTADWSAVTGRLHRFQRDNESADWQSVGQPFPIVVGRNGLVWGAGLRPNPETSSPVKIEGDKKAPAGIFSLGDSFGLVAPEDVRWIKLPYRQLHAPIECVDDSNSVHYNTIVDREKIGNVDWNSSEKMSQIREQYRFGIVVNHNVSPPRPGAGSCVFLHIWETAVKGTAGCTAMAPEQIEKLLRWLDPAKSPRLVQLPVAQYKQLQAEWQLPPLALPD